MESLTRDSIPRVAKAKNKAAKPRDNDDYVLPEKLKKITKKKKKREDKMFLSQSLSNFLNTGGDEFEMWFHDSIQLHFRPCSYDDLKSTWENPEFIPEDVRRQVLLLFAQQLAGDVLKDLCDMRFITKKSSEIKREVFAQQLFQQLWFKFTPAYYFNKTTARFMDLLWCVVEVLKQEHFFRMIKHSKGCGIYLLVPVEPFEDEDDSDDEFFTFNFDEPIQLPEMEIILGEALGVNPFPF